MLHSAIDEHYGLLAFAVHFHLVAAHFGYKILGVRVVERNILTTLDYYFSQHRTVFTQMLRQLSGVYSVDSGDVLLLEPVGKAAVGLPVAVLPRIILSHDCLAMDVVALIVFAHIILFTPGRNAVISKYGIGGN